MVAPPIAVPPVRELYQRYCPAVPPDAVRVTTPVPHNEPPVVVGAGIAELIVATTEVLVLSHVPSLTDT